MQFFTALCTVQARLKITHVDEEEEKSRDGRTIVSVFITILNGTD